LSQKGESRATINPHLLLEVSEVEGNRILTLHALLDQPVNVGAGSRNRTGMKRAFRGRDRPEAD
jgi:hypothetical protein